MEDTKLEQLKQELTAEIDALGREVELVYTALVLPRWGTSDYHGLPRTLYGYVMSSFSIIDLVSQHRYDDGRQTARMRRFLEDQLGTSSEPAAVAVQLWRHTLMHTANPRTLVDLGSGRTYRWLLHWREHLPREQHMKLQQAGGDSVLSVGLMYLVEDLAAGVRGALADAETSAELRERFLAVSGALSTQRVRL
jgi:hypothetical protein